LVKITLIVIAVILIAVVATIGLLLYHTAHEVRKTQPLSNIDAIIKSLMGNIPRKIEVTSPAFTYGATIPRIYTCDGEDISLPLQWSKVEGARYYAIIMIDPDAPKGIFIHWIIYNILSNVTSLKANIPKKEAVQGIGLQSLNDFGRIGYGGPCPPHGSKHRYIFIVVALRNSVNVDPGSSPLKTLNGVKELAMSYGFTYAYYGR